MRKIFFGADHGGFELKNNLIKGINRAAFQTVDLGPRAYDPEDDFPEYAFGVAEKVSRTKGAIGVLACRSGAGMAMAANKVRGVRAVECWDVRSAKHARQHNDANVLVLSGDWLRFSKAAQILRAFLTTPFSGKARYIRRNRKIAAYEKKRS